MKSEASFVRTLLDSLARLFGTGQAQDPNPPQRRGTSRAGGTATGTGPRPASPKARTKGPSKSASKGRGNAGTAASPARAAAKPAPRPAPAPAVVGGTASWEDGGYPGDFTGTVRARYAPSPDGRPDPGEIVWAWVPYEEDHAQGKDRPVLLVGRDGDYLLALMLTSKDRNNVTRRDEDYMDIGTGPWDRQGRPSEVKLDRVVRLLPGAVRREGAVLDRERFEAVARSL
ncbi:hypothetical protein GCM10023081_29790 [Arthrobacter ginkgonis]|uniref:RNA 3'-terminal phosphate cyclase n=1 Tax=Arthrobacter ginkgonis TaxID=1630594 RepID=A0ABP7CK04_9MICC